MTTIPVDQVRYIKEFQPRLDVDDTWIEQLRTALDRLPPITVARGNVLVDGYHRWQAHLREGAEFIDAQDLGDLSDDEIFWEAVQRNSAAGKQLSLKDKRRIAAERYERMDPKTAVAELSGRLSVDETTVRRWTKDARAALEEQRKARAWSLWLDCLTQEQIAEQIDTPQQTVSRWLNTQIGQLPEMSTAPGATDDKPWGTVQHFDVWSFQNADKDAGAQSYFGALPPQVVQNLLWLYTDPGEIVVDLFAGSGTTIDVAKAMGRRVWASDIRGDHYSPHLPIHTHDVTTGWPDDSPSKAKLVVLDPPYWQQAKGRYSTEPNELAEKPLVEFYADWDRVLKSVRDRAERVAYIISPTQLDDGTVVDHATDMLRSAWEHGYTVERRIIVTYQTQQATGQQVEWARENKRLLKLYRDLGGAPSVTFSARFAAAVPWEQELITILQRRGWLAAPFGQAQIPEEMRRHLAAWEDQYGRPTLLRWAPDIIAVHPATGRVCLVDAKTDDGETSNYAIECHAVDAGNAIVQYLFTPVYYVWRTGTLTPEVVLNRWHRKLDGKRSKGSKTSFYLVDKSFAVKGSTIFGDVIQEAS